MAFALFKGSVVFSRKDLEDAVRTVGLSMLRESDTSPINYSGFVDYLSDSERLGLPPVNQMFKMPSPHINDAYFSNGLMQWVEGDQEGALFWLNKCAESPQDYPLGTLFYAMASLNLGHVQKGVALLSALKDAGNSTSNYTQFPVSGLFIQEAVSYWMGVFQLYALHGYAQNDENTAEASSAFFSVRRDKKQDLRAYVHQLIAGICSQETPESIEFRLDLQEPLTLIGSSRSSQNVSLWESPEAVLVLAVMYYFLIQNNYDFNRVSAGQVFGHLMSGYWAGVYDTSPLYSDLGLLVSCVNAEMAKW